MPKYRKKPVVVEAEQITKEMLKKLSGRTKSYYTDEGERRLITFYDDHVVIETLEGNMVGNVGDWIITGVHGERYPCKDHIFQQTYERVEDETHG